MRSLALLALAALGAAPAAAQTRFPTPFFFGLATAPGQSEDRLDDVWLDWARAGKVAAFANQAVPGERLEFWTRPQVELDLAARTGIGVYRLGVDWGRVEPRRGVFDEKAIARYRAILGMVRARRMKVMLTLMHHSVPKWLQARGGWTNDAAIGDYLVFAERMIDEYHAQVSWWVTFNEPNVFASLAYGAGLWPPGKPDSPLSLLAVGPFRGAAVRALDRMADAHDALYAWAHRRYPDVRIGIAQNMAYYTGRSRLDRLEALYPDRLLNWRFPERVRGRLDFFGVNYYGAEWVHDARLVLDPRAEYSESGRAIDPNGLLTILTEVHARFPRPPIVVTENGIADSTDVLRPAYLIEHLQAVAAARAAGIPVEGYVWWTLSDNWEWSDGYCPKFGLVAVDRARGLKRIPRPSYFLFRRIVETRRITTAMRARAWAEVAAHAGRERPFCRAADAVTALDAPRERRFVRTDWRFR
ncbi:MAG: glycoside hydrolase family 1 protein [Elusimicrobia bacterium]|nr:glycoside hydrolase family 1 protein [Elusimicrobiota bacterium]